MPQIDKVEMVTKIQCIEFHGRWQRNQEEDREETMPGDIMIHLQSDLAC